MNFDNTVSRPSNTSALQFRYLVSEKNSFPCQQAPSPAFAGQSYDSLIRQIVNIYNYKMPKAPRRGSSEANWLKMTWLWFFEQGKSPARFRSNSPESLAIAASVSMKEVKEEFFKTGNPPMGWSPAESKIAAEEFGEAEWFTGAYSIRNFTLSKGVASFTVYNKSDWNSPPLLPDIWCRTIEEATSYALAELVTNAPRGEVFKTKIKHCFPEESKIPGSGYLLALLPSFGGTWEQYYDIRMEWK